MQKTWKPGEVEVVVSYCGRDMTFVLLANDCDQL